jgi:hypothetical protein
MTRAAGPPIKRLGEGEEGLAVPVRDDGGCEVVVELHRDVPRQLEVLLLVLADRNMGRPVGQDVGGHQGRVGEEADGGVLPVLARLLLELRHAVEPAHAGDAVEHPGELGVLVDPGLVEHDVLLRVDAGGDEGGGDLAGLAGQFLRPAPDGDGLSDRVEVDDAVDAIVRVLKVNEPPDRAEVVAEVQVARGLDAREHPLRERHHRGLREGAVVWQGRGRSASAPRPRVIPAGAPDQVRGKLRGEPGPLGR